ncbi:hypothetical protein A6V39_04790 [Candidatus Mycoplasma haematobovis]|uniref:ATP synthase subunit b n=1 Tax=Candidatus Mycoplasma haematobovis TaxID=432608 RepID=A0A1A9QD20_9MOLU|nr:hypothetical protein [Candidatus Mycoplasma haematobovis]OAL09866.1 hypothetical protein A6V39_04790 [Candidatus Mycoplasma haematobovis]
MEVDFWEWFNKIFWIDGFVLNEDGISFSQEVKKFLNDHLSVNFWTLLIHVLCAIVIIACITVWVWKPTNDFIDKNKKLLDKTKQDLIVSSRETKYFLNLLKKERNYLFNLRRNTEEAARHEASRILTEANRNADKITASAKAEVDHRIKIIEQKAKDEIKGSVVRLSMELTQKLIGAHINEENSRHVIDAYLKDLEDKKITSKLN